MNIIKLNTQLNSIAGGAAVGAGAGYFILKDWKKGAIMGALVTVLAPTGEGLVAKVMPKGAAGAAGAAGAPAL